MAYGVEVTYAQVGKNYPREDGGIHEEADTIVRTIKDIFRSYAVFDAHGRHVNGTDKQSNHNYSDVYETIIYHHFGSRHQVKLMMEVGVADGSCLLAWREVFPNAQIVGMDIHHSDRAHGDRIEFHIGDQRVREDCERVATKWRLFDLIVEDATHILENSLLTLFWLWPSVRPGGLYIVEEFANVGALKDNINALFPTVEIVDTIGPSGGSEPLVVLRKPR